jgi:hypothetical protein
VTFVLDFLSDRAIAPTIRPMSVTILQREIASSYRARHRAKPWEAIPKSAIGMNEVTR